MSSVVQKSESKSRLSWPRTGREFPRTAKLLKHASFDQVYKRGQRQFSGFMTVFFLRRAQEGGPSGQSGSQAQTQVQGPRVGFTVGRVLGNSVVRNRIRRRMREAVRFNLDSLPGDVDVVINPKKSVMDAEFTRLVAEVERMFEKIGKSEELGKSRTRTGV